MELQTIGRIRGRQREGIRLPCAIPGPANMPGPRMQHVRRPAAPELTRRLPSPFAIAAASPWAPRFIPCDSHAPTTCRSRLTVEQEMPSISPFLFGESPKSQFHVFDVSRVSGLSPTIPTTDRCGRGALLLDLVEPQSRWSLL